MRSVPQDLLAALNEIGLNKPEKASFGRLLRAEKRRMVLDDNYAS
jgi:hypothetical protein